TVHNAAVNGVGSLVTVYPGLGLAPVLAMTPRPRVRAIVSNPPYVTSTEMKNLPVEIARHEPRLALDGGSDGLDVIRKLVAQAGEVLLSGGLLAMEIGAGQGNAMRALFAASGWRESRIEQDLAGRDRYALA